MVKFFKSMLSWICSFGIAIVITLLIGIFGIQPYTVEGHSMDPTLHDQQKVLVSKIPNSFPGTIERGDIVIIDSRVHEARTIRDDIMEQPIMRWLSDEPTDSIYVKRVIAKAGDELELNQGQVYLNGTLMDEPYIKEEMMNQGDQTWDVPEGYVFVMGDNRNNSNDSRVLGFIPLSHVIGKKLN
ncbi:Signal peptidase IB [compost metagenome]